MNPKFSVGEIVIVQSPNYPETNGEYEVIQIFNYEEFLVYCEGAFKSESQPLVYRLKDYVAFGKIKVGSKTDCVSEPSLRKKHQPGEMDYKELMQTLKNSVLEWN